MLISVNTVQDANNSEAEQQLTKQHKEKMADLLAETEQQLLNQNRQLHACIAKLNYFRNKSALCAEHAKVLNSCVYSMVP